MQRTDRPSSAFTKAGKPSWIINYSTRNFLPSNDEKNTPRETATEEFTAREMLICLTHKVEDLTNHDMTEHGTQIKEGRINKISS